MGGRFLKADTQSISEFDKYFRLRANIRCMVAPVKLWIHQRKPNEATYGLTFKIIKVIVTLPFGRSLRNQEEEHMVDFLDIDSD